MIETENGNMSIACPESTFDEEVTVRIREITAGTFVFPTGYQAASLAYLVDLDKEVKFRKEVAIQMHHSANKKDTEKLIFVYTSSNLKPADDSKYIFEMVKGGIFSNDHGKVSLDHFGIIAIAGDGTVDISMEEVLNYESFLSSK